VTLALEGPESMRVVVGQPRNAGGTDSGPMPIEMLRVSLATRNGRRMRRYLATHP
jgi:hypothetical protein